MPSDTLAPIGSLVAPASIAVVGASSSSFVGRVLCENLRTLGYSGRVYPVNPRYQEILGWRCYPSLEALPEPPEAVVSAVRIDLAPEVLRGAGKLGARAAVIPGGGFTETGERVLAVHREIGAAAAEFGMAVCGPNCMGVISPGRRAALYIGSIPASLLPGRVALVSQSGSVVEAAVNMGPRVGFSTLISCGNEAATTIGQYLQYLARDEETGAVILFVEGFRDPAGFVEGARALREAGKPLAVLQAGRSEEAGAAVTAHSGSLAGAPEVVAGLLHQLGAIGVDDLDELFEVAELLGHGRLPAGRRLFVVTDSGGEANLIADHARRIGLDLPVPSDRLRERLQARWPHFAYIGNPIDPWGVDLDYETLYGQILEAAGDEDVDVVAVALDKVTPWAGQNEVELGLAAAKALILGTAGSRAMPVFFTVHATGPAVESVRERLRAAGVPLLHGLRPALVAVRRAWYWQQWKPRSAVARGGGPTSLSIGEPGPILSERASRDVLASYGVPVVPGRVARTSAEAVDAAEALGFPVVMKADMPGMAHKLASGLLRTGVASRPDVGASFAALSARAASFGNAWDGLLVEATASGVELICGMRRDPLFGPVVLVGMGGSFAEILRDVAVRVCPPSREDLWEMLDECAAGRVLAAAGVDPGPVTEVIAALSCLALDHADIEEIDVNPLFAGRDGAVAADALVVVQRGETG